MNEAGKKKKVTLFFFSFFTPRIQPIQPSTNKTNDRSVKNAYDKEYDVQAWFQLRGFLMQCFGSWNADAPYTALGGKADYATGITGVTQWQSAAEPASN
jgi:hypothetical protein